ncbi:Lysine-specific demethylase JMJ30 [Vitis vinifera]|uniref:Lysine-specific demethylase JMJ30 n=1 Tax=Vitis vinifera TaxID=29760 RepID=A0A438ELU1_VITVI|nr:Lysine-specific demethylase JMJ30 [Vitis vinifera]
MLTTVPNQNPPFPPTLLLSLWSTTQHTPQSVDHGLQHAGILPTTCLKPNPRLRIPNLLHQISEQGGYAYVSMSVLAAAGDLRAAEATREMAWEQLHSGPWHSVLPVWRDAYSMACLYVAKLHHRAGDFGEALKVFGHGTDHGRHTSAPGFARCGREGNGESE